MSIANRFNPQRSLRARVSLIFGSLAVFLNILFIVFIKITAQVSLANGEMPAQVLIQVQRNIVAYGIFTSLVFFVIGWLLS